MNKKRTIKSIMLCMVVATIMSMFGCTTSEKIPLPKVEKNIYVYDNDDIIEDDVEKELNKMLVELEEKTETEFVIVTVTSLLDKSINSYANNLFNTIGIGKKGKDNGALLLISRSDGEVRIEIGRGLEGFLNDAKCGRILDAYFVPHRENDEYTEATRATVYAVLNVFCEEYGISITGLSSESIQVEEPHKLTVGQWIIIIVVIIVILIVIGCICGSDGVVCLIDLLVDILGAILGSGGGSSGGGFSRGGGARR